MSLRNLGFSQKLGRLFWTLLTVLGLTGINGCEGLSWHDDEVVARVKSQGEIRILTLNHPLVHESRPQGADKGQEHDLLTHFAESYGLKIRFVVKKNLEDIFAGLRKGEGHMAAARLWTVEESSGFLTGPAFEESHLSLFCQKNLKIENIRDLSLRRVGLAARDNLAAFEARLRLFVPDIDLRLEETVSARDLLRRIQKGTLDCAILENLEGGIFSRSMPTVEKVSSLTKNHSLSWVLAPDQSDLLSLMHTWFQQASRDDEIMRIQDRYQSSLSELDRHDVRRFLLSIRHKFPTYSKAFRESSAEHQLDWKLVASVAYQESHWQSDARSFTGVRGLMQLTEETAAHVGIEDRTDPLQSIWGGAFYLRSLMDRMPKNLDASERLSLALAAYNCGLAHLRDAQTLASERGLNPFSWRHLKQVLPDLEDPEIAAQLPFGTARGRETVQFVERVRSFYGLWRVLD